MLCGPASAGTPAEALLIERSFDSDCAPLYIILSAPLHCVALAPPPVFATVPLHALWLASVLSPLLALGPERGEIFATSSPVVGRLYNRTALTQALVQNKRKQDTLPFLTILSVSTGYQLLSSNYVM